MKILNHKFIIVCNFILLVLLFGCSETFLEQAPIGPNSQETLANSAGVNGLLIGAYSMLDGWGGDSGPRWGSSVSNWIYGGVASDDAHKGSTYDDVSPISNIENYSVNPTNEYMNVKWVHLYKAIQRANSVITVLALVEDNSISDDAQIEIKAQAVFLRAYFHFQAAKMWRNVPYIDETNNYETGDYLVDNTVPIWPKIETDFQFAIDNLNATQGDVGRANSWVAKVFLAKTYMFQHKYNEAKTLLDDIIANGVNSVGVKYALLPDFSSNFDPSYDNNSEGVFEVQMSINDGTRGRNGNVADVLNYAYAGPSDCCGFYLPSFSLVNSYKTDSAEGLPLLDTWNDGDIENDQGILSNEAFTPYTGTVDPRLDFTVGRRGIPFQDWGIMPGYNWIRAQSQSGPYINKKIAISEANSEIYTEAQDGNSQATSMNYKVIRFADVLLLAAEAEVEVGSLSKAEDYVNMIRARALNSTWVNTYIDPDDPSQGFTNTPAANYKIGLYPVGQFETNGQDYARKAIRFERKIELAMEGHRFFDLQRWDNGTGYMADVLNAYIQHETQVPFFDYQILKSAVFTKGRNEIFPISQRQIDLSESGGVPILKQNPNY